MVWRMNCKDGKSGWMPSDQIGGPCINQNTGYDGGNNEYDEEESSLDIF